MPRDAGSLVGECNASDQIVFERGWRDPNSPRVHHARAPRTTKRPSRFPNGSGGRSAPELLRFLFLLCSETVANRYWLAEAIDVSKIIHDQTWLIRNQGKTLSKKLDLVRCTALLAMASRILGRHDLYFEHLVWEFTKHTKS